MTWAREANHGRMDVIRMPKTAKLRQEEKQELVQLAPSKPTQSDFLGLA